MSELSDIATELQAAEDGLKSKIEKLFGAVHTTDFAAEFAVLMSVHDKIMVLAGLQPSPSTGLTDTTPPPPAEAPAA